MNRFCGIWNQLLSLFPKAQFFQAVKKTNDIAGIHLLETIHSHINCHADFMFSPTGSPGFPGHFPTW